MKIMLKIRLQKYCAAALILLMLGAANVQTVSAVSQIRAQTTDAEKIKRTVAEAGVGEKARVTVTTRDGKRLSGFITEARADDFVLTETKTNNRVTVLYADALRIKRNKLSLAAKIGIGVGIGVAAYIIVIAAVTKGFQKTGN